MAPSVAVLDSVFVKVPNLPRRAPFSIPTRRPTVTDTQRIQDQIDRLALDLPRRLPPELRQIFLVHYPGEACDQIAAEGRVH